MILIQTSKLIIKIKISMTVKSARFTPLPMVEYLEKGTFEEYYRNINCKCFTLSINISTGKSLPTGPQPVVTKIAIRQNLTNKTKVTKKLLRCN